MFKINELLEATGANLISQGKVFIVKGVSIDSRSIKPGDLFLAIKGDNFDGHDFIDQAVKKGATCIIGERIRRGLLKKKSKLYKNVSFLEVDETIKALGDIARFHRNKFDLPVVAVTGSNGKTTTKEMISWVLSKEFNVLKNEGTKNNQIGVPLTLLNLNHRHQVVVVELGTNQFGEIEYLSGICRPSIGVITNIGPSHLEQLVSLNGVLLEKSALLENLQLPGIAILNNDDEKLRGKISAENNNVFVLGFGIAQRSDFQAADIKVSSDKIGFWINSKQKITLKTPGSCNIYNALAAITVGRVFGIAYKDIALRLSSCSFPKSRLNIKKIKDTTFIDDSYNSNPLSLKNALSTLAELKTKGRKIVVMGDMLELGNAKESYHRDAGENAAGVCDVLVTVGKLAKLAAQTARSCGFDIKNIFTCSSSSEAKEVLFNKISPDKNDVVLIKGSRLMALEEIINNR